VTHAEQESWLPWLPTGGKQLCVELSIDEGSWPGCIPKEGRRSGFGGGGLEKTETPASAPGGSGKQPMPNSANAFEEHTQANASKTRRLKAPIMPFRIPGTLSRL
jgi:hypothetical protein